MSRTNTTSPEDAVSKGFIVAGPRKSDPVGGALRIAFERQDAARDDFSSLLRLIDLADREAGSC
jgi:hypothetical protein